MQANAEISSHVNVSVTQPFRAPNTAGLDKIRHSGAELIYRFYFGMDKKTTCTIASLFNLLLGEQRLQRPARKPGNTVYRHVQRSTQWELLEFLLTSTLS